MSGEIKTRQELVGNVDSPFAIGQKPQNQDFQNLLASILFPGEDTAAVLAADPTSIAFWLTFFSDEDLPEDEQGRKTLMGMLNRLLTWTSARLEAPTTLPIMPSVAYVDADTFTVPADITATLLVGARVRANLAGTYVYGAVASRTYSAPNTTVNLTLDNVGQPLTSALSGVDISLLDGLLVRNVTGPQVVNGLGYTPANKAGDEFTGPVVAPSFQAGDGDIYGKLTVTTAAPGVDDGEDGDIWLVYVP